MKKWCKFLFLLMAVAVCVTGCKIGNTRIQIGDIEYSQKYVFVLDGMECSRQEAWIYLCNYKNLYGTTYGLDIWQYDFGEDSLEEYVKQVSLAELTRIFTMESLAKEQEISLEDEEKELAEKAAKEYFESLNETEIKFMDVRFKDVENAYLRYALANKLYHSLSDNVVREVSDDEARVIRVQQILVTDPQAAEAVSARLEKGEKFETVATSYNQGTTTEITVARGEYPPEVEKVAFDLDSNAYSGMITGSNGFYFIKCMSKFEEELTEENKQKILVKREKEEFEEKYQAHARKVDFVLNEKLWEHMSLAKSKDVKTDTFFSLYEEIYDRGGVQ